MRLGGHRAASAFAGLALLGAGCGGTSGEGTAKAAPPSGPRVARVSSVTPERMTIRRVTEQPGQIEAIEVTPVHAKLSGFVRTVSVDIGDRVKEGQVMAELRVPEVEADFKQKKAMIEKAEAEREQSTASVAVARAGVASAEAKIAEIRAGTRRADADLARWKAEFGRIEQLVRDRAQTGSLLDETRHKMDSAEATREEVRAQVRSAEAALAEAKALADKARSDVQAAASHVEVARFEAERAEAMASYTKITAPYDGVVTRRKVDTGQLTMPGTSGDPLFVVARSDIVTISVGVPEADALSVNAGDAAQVRLLALDGRKFEGRVTRTAWALESATRTLLVEIDLPSVDEALRPGLYAYATVIAEEHKDVLTLPTTAIIKDGGKSFCMTVAAKQAKRREIQLGLNDAKRTEVVSGIAEGEMVVEANAASLADGQPVEVNEPPAEPAKPKG